jgi:hypothetical protein
MDRTLSAGASFESAGVAAMVGRSVGVGAAVGVGALGVGEQATRSAIQSMAKT